MFDPRVCPVDPETVVPEDDGEFAVELSDEDLAVLAGMRERFDANPPRVSKRQRRLIEFHNGLDADLDRPRAPVEVDATQVLAAAGVVQRRVNLAQAEQLALAAKWADLNSTLDCPSRHGVASERLVQPGGDGTPRVAELCPAELGAVIGVSVTAAQGLVADALDLRHRLPRLWRRVWVGDVKPWVARRVATKTRHLSLAAAGRVDARVAGLVDTVPFGRLMRVLDAEILRADPDQAAADSEAAAGQQGVWVSRESDHGYATLVAKAPAPDLAAVDVSLDELARALTILGDDDSHDVRRAKALGLLADPAAALDLIRQANDTLTTGEQHQRGCDLGTAVLYVHLTDHTLTDGGGVVRVEDIGPALLGQVRDWLGHRQVVVKPVIDIPGIRPVDCYETPVRMADAVRLRTPASAFPYSSNVSRTGDLDHTRPYVGRDDGGPPGQTRPDNLARMTRTEHRIKTFTRWTPRQIRSGAWLWRSPHRYYYLVDEHGTTPLGKLLE